jgi:hypothetical protein
MKVSLLLTTGLLLSTLSYSQSNKAYAITGQGKGNLNWSNIREIDLATGNVTSTIYELGKTNFSIADANTKKPIGNEGVSPLINMSAAAAYDAKHNKLFFVAMRSGELRWIDLNSKSDNLKFYTGTPLVESANYNDEANNITRMTIGADGYGYALTNDGNHLLRFSTGSKVVVTDMGNLIDAPANNGLSVHNKCSSWGGDMIADAMGNLYLFTATHNIFTIDIKTRVASYTGTILSLPGSFTTNGAVVDKNDNVIVGSANTFDGFYSVNMKTLVATKLATTGTVYNTSDLANGNLLYQNQQNTLGSATLQQEIIGNQFISIYPNPVTGSQFRMSFDKVQPGTYSVVVTDLQGRTVAVKELYIKSTNQVENINLAKKPASGMYMIKVIDSDKKSVYSDKLVIN